jgi:hypothetical protein
LLNGLASKSFRTTLRLGPRISGYKFMRAKYIERTQYFRRMQEIELWSERGLSREITKVSKTYKGRLMYIDQQIRGGIDEFAFLKLRYFTQSTHRTLEEVKLE